VQVDDSETRQSWRALFVWLKERGLHLVDLVDSDDDKGLVKAIETQFLGALG
jgi:transposase-like protein